MMKKSILITSILLITGCKQNMEDITRAGIIPAPSHVAYQEGTFSLSRDIQLSLPDKDGMESIVNALHRIFTTTNGFSLTWIEKQDNSADIRFHKVKNQNLGEEGYALEISTKGIDIMANHEVGFYYALQSLRQLLPEELESESGDLNFPIQLSALTIADTPRFGWRGMHLDVSRHFFSVEDVKSYIDLLAMHKMNTFHWHLIDDQGWRLEIEKYPRLTDIGAWRVERSEEPEWRNIKKPEPKEPTTYGGFYTKDDVRDIVRYAAERHINVLPEIEMPAHVMSAIAAYPELSCQGDSIPVPPGSVWPITTIYCAGNDDVFDFLEDVLFEVMELFPYEYIHIGGDEAFKQEWEICPKCQKRIEEEGLEDEAELQSYFTRRIERFLNTNGKKLIGWDEILEGGLSPNATVMSWRGEVGGIHAARAGQDAIMSPTSHCYFDYYQANPDNEPLAIGNYTPLRKVYQYEPIPAELKKHERKHILGAQGNVWTEYMHTIQHVQYMALPRMSALAEVVWSPKSHRDWTAFNERLQGLLRRFTLRDISYSLGSYDIGVQPSFDKKSNSMIVHLVSDQFNPIIKYTLDGSEPTMDSKNYIGPIILTRSTEIKACLVHENDLVPYITRDKVAIHKGIGKKIVYGTPYHDGYRAAGKKNLNNGVLGTEYFRDERWQGFLGTDVDITVDLGSVEPLSIISTRFYSTISSWIFQPESVTISVSETGKNFTEIFHSVNTLTEDTENKEILTYAYEGPPIKARYVKLTGKSIGVCPEWHKGAGSNAFMFVDEIIIE